jgi:hypothetical protein
MSGKFADDTRGFVETAIIDDDDFVRPSLRGQVPHDGVQMRKNAGRFIVCWDDD